MTPDHPEVMFDPMRAMITVLTIGNSLPRTCSRRAKQMSLIPWGRQNVVRAIAVSLHYYYQPSRI